MVLDICWQAVPWFAALAAAYRAEMTQHARAENLHNTGLRAPPWPLENFPIVISRA
ncbi:MAG: hypothetical protein IPJ07_10785 [Acidobacteria bacterium]|nr:hypothetical protein [Acidobacteriota bacterium]